jgi:predicted MFS family arabinose efflux permease
LTAAVLLHATPTQMGLMTSMAIVPFILFSLPGGVWLDRVRKLPVYVVGETAAAFALLSVPVAWWLGWLGMPWMYAVEFFMGLVHTIAGSAAQVVLTQVVPRDRLVEAHAKNALATSGSEVAGPAFAGVLIKLMTAPVALAFDAAMLLASALILRGIRVQERLEASAETFWQQLKTGLRFVATNRVLVALALVMGLWQMAHHAAVVVQILIATRTLGLTEQQVGLCYVGVGFGTISASMLGHRISARVGPGRCLVLGFAITGLAWLLLAVARPGPWGVAAFATMLLCFAAGAVFIFINFLALRQAVTPPPLLGRMTSCMRWLTLLAAGPGALIGGWLGEHVALQATMAFAGTVSLLLVLLAWRMPVIWNLRRLPQAA